MIKNSRMRNNLYLLTEALLSASDVHPRTHKLRTCVIYSLMISSCQEFSRYHTSCILQCHCVLRLHI